MLSSEFQFFINVVGALSGFCRGGFLTGNKDFFHLCLSLNFKNYDNKNHSNPSFLYSQFL